MSDAPTPLNARSEVLFLALVTVAALAVRVVMLGDGDFWSDEVHTFQALERPSGELISERLAAGHLPVYFLALKGWAAVAGTGHFALRLPSALFGAAMVVPAYAAFRRLMQRSAARWATVLLVLHPLLIELSREARMYSVLAFAFVVTLEGMVRATDRGRVPWTFWAGVIAGALVHPSWLFGVVALAVWAWLDPAAGAAAVRKRLLVGCAVSAVVLVAGLVGVDAAAHSEFVRRPWLREIGVYVLRQVNGSRLLAASTGWHVGVFVAWSIAAAFGLCRASRRVRVLAITLLVGVHGLCVVTALAGGATWGPVRYVMLGSVGLAVLAGVGAAAFPRRTGSLLVLALLVALVAVVLRGADTRWSGQAAQIRSNAVDEDVSVHAAPGAGARLVLRHYLRHPRE